jgi:hypothetical protein
MALPWRPTPWLRWFDRVGGCVFGGCVLGRTRGVVTKRQNALRTFCVVAKGTTPQASVAEACCVLGNDVNKARGVRLNMSLKLLALVLMLVIVLRLVGELVAVPLLVLVCDRDRMVHVRFCVDEVSPRPELCRPTFFAHSPPLRPETHNNRRCWWRPRLTRSRSRLTKRGCRSWGRLGRGGGGGSWWRCWASGASECAWVAGGEGGGGGGGGCVGGGNML